MAKESKSGFLLIPLEPCKHDKGMFMKRAVLLISHGSRSPLTKGEIENLTNKIKIKSQISIVEFAFLEIESPSIPEGIQSCVLKGAKEIIVLLNFLNSGRHVNEDIPNIVKEESLKYPDIRVAISKPIGQHPQIHNLFIDVLNEARP